MRALSWSASCFGVVTDYARELLLNFTIENGMPLNIALPRWRIKRVPRFFVG